MKEVQGMSVHCRECSKGSLLVLIHQLVLLAEQQRPCAVKAAMSHQAPAPRLLVCRPW
jgi:hypothetical protein